MTDREMLDAVTIDMLDGEARDLADTLACSSPAVPLPQKCREQKSEHKEQSFEPRGAKADKTHAQIKKCLYFE